MTIFTFFLTLGSVCLFFVCGAFALVSVSVMEEDTVTLYSDVEMKQQDRMIWFFGEDRIAVIIGDQSKICKDDECKERFRDRLKLDHQTGSLTIRDIRTTDSGEYTLEIPSRNIDNIFNVTVDGVSAAERDEIKRKSVKEGESVTLDTRVTKNPTDLMTWYLNDIIIAEITGDQSKICTDVQCKERFGDRLKLDHQTGSLTIMNTRNTDSGDYELEIISSRFSISRSFTLIVSDSGSSVVVAVLLFLLLIFLLVAVAVGVVVFFLLLHLLFGPVVFYKRRAKVKCTRKQRRSPRDDAQDTSHDQADALMKTASNGTPHNKTEAANMTQL